MPPLFGLMIFDDEMRSRRKIMRMKGEKGLTRMSGKKEGIRITSPILSLSLSSHLWEAFSSST